MVLQKPTPFQPSYLKAHGWNDRRSHENQPFSYMRVGTRLVSCRFFAQTNRLELGRLIVGQVREGNSTRHNSTCHTSTRHNSTRHTSTRPQLDTPQLYTATTRHAITLHRPHGRKVEATIEYRTVRTKVSFVFLLFSRRVITFTLCSYPSLLYSSFNHTDIWSV